MVPASLREKTLAEREAYGRDWRLPENLLVISYESTQTVRGADTLERLAPVAIICDEAHALRRTSAARTRRFTRYVKAHRPRLMILSGSMMRRSLMDYWHLMVAALAQGAPLPMSKATAERWAESVDPGDSDRARPYPGPLLDWCLPMQSTGDPVASARQGLRNRIACTVGCVLGDQEPLLTDLVIRRRVCPPPPEVVSAVQMVRDSGETPNGDLITDAPMLWAIERELASGFFYRWDPPPPTSWMAARKAWGRVVREYLGRHIAGVDSPLQVAQRLPQHPDLLRWQAARPTYEINAVATWVSDYLIQDAAAWLAEHRGLVWCEHVAWGERLAAHARVPYFGGGSEAASAIVHHRGPAVLSIDAHGTGRNLQHHHANLIVSPPSSGLAWEQLLGRTYRPGQTQTVTVDVYIQTDSALASVKKSLDDADAIEYTHGDRQRLRMALLDIDLTEDNEHDDDT
jgi:hypothetical protein